MNKLTSLDKLTKDITCAGVSKGTAMGGFDLQEGQNQLKLSANLVKAYFKMHVLYLQGMKGFGPNTKWVVPMKPTEKKQELPKTFLKKSQCHQRPLSPLEPSLTFLKLTKFLGFPLCSVDGSDGFEFAFHWIAYAGLAVATISSFGVFLFLQGAFW